MTHMRAKFHILAITKGVNYEVLEMGAIAAKSYPEDGADEDNTYARWSPQASLKLTIANPALHGKFAPGEKFYVDFTKAPE